MCPRRHIETHDGYMTGDLWKRLIDEVSEVNSETVIIPFWRGESLLHPYFTEFVNYALSKSLKLHISSNGHVLRPEQAEVLKRCEFVTFSVHTDKSYENAKVFLTLKSKTRPMVQVSFVRGEMTEKNILNRIISSPDLEGFDSVRLYDEHTLNGVFGRSGIDCRKGRTFCKKLNDTIVIAYDGTASRCNHVWETETGIDLNTMSIKEAWNSRCLSLIRNNYPDKFCSSCDQWSGHTCGESWRFMNGTLEHIVYKATGIAYE